MKPIMMPCCTERATIKKITHFSVVQFPQPLRLFADMRRIAQINSAA